MVRISNNSILHFRRDEESKARVCVVLVRGGGGGGGGGLYDPSSDAFGLKRALCSINVLLSRAKHGMYIIGSADTIRKKNTMWRSVIERLDSDGCLGPALPLVCQNHPSTSSLIKNPEDFATVRPQHQTAVLFVTGGTSSCAAGGRRRMHQIV